MTATPQKLGCSVCHGIFTENEVVTEGDRFICKACLARERAEIPYQVKKSILDSVDQEVHYRCPACRAELNTDLEKAGTEEACPKCGHVYMVPGTRELAEKRERDQDRPKPPEPSTKRKAIRICFKTLFIVTAFLCAGETLVMHINLGQKRSTAWPVHHTSEAVRLPDGRYAVPLPDIGRIQIYSADLKFQYGFPAPDVSRRGLVMSATPQGKLEIYGGSQHLIYDTDGNLLSNETSDHQYAPNPNAVSLRIPAPWWTFPFNRLAINILLIWVWGIFWAMTRQWELNPEMSLREILRQR